MTNIKVVIGANFGDEGKGLMTDYFVRQNQEQSNLVVLFNGGAQRAHTVTTKMGQRHVFRHLGAGTLANADTYFAKHFIINPIIFRQEYEEMQNKYNISPKVYINKNCIFTTLYDMFINQALERSRGSVKHGSCGFGIFETIKRNKLSSFNFVTPIRINPAAATVQEFSSMFYLSRFNFLDWIRKEYLPQRLNEFSLLDKDDAVYQSVISTEAINHYIEDFNFMLEHSTLVDDDIVYDYDNVIFEGGQGLLLDKDNKEYFPHLSPSNTGLKNVAELLGSLNPRLLNTYVEVCYITRTYMTRHGVGRFDTECEKRMINENMQDATNVPNPFQDSLRYGYLNTRELLNRCYKDIKDNVLKNFYFKATFAVTHINEYNQGVNFADYISCGQTAKDTIKLKKS